MEKLINENIRGDGSYPLGEIRLKQNEYVKNVPNFCLLSVANFVDSCPRPRPHSKLDAPDDFVWFTAQPCRICLVLVCTRNKIQFNLCPLEWFNAYAILPFANCFGLYVKQSNRRI